MTMPSSTTCATGLRASVYYRARFDPQTLRDVGWPGEVTEIGGWGGVFNGGAWLDIDGRRTDVHYRSSRSAR
jgi:hypothetical protein